MSGLISGSGNEYGDGDGWRPQDDGQWHPNGGRWSEDGDEFWPEYGGGRGTRRGGDPGRGLWDEQPDQYREQPGRYQDEQPGRYQNQQPGRYQNERSGRYPGELLRGYEGELTGGLWAEYGATSEPYEPHQPRRRRRSRGGRRGGRRGGGWSGPGGRRDLGGPGGWNYRRRALNARGLDAHGLRALNMRTLAPIAIPMALALVLGMVLALAGSNNTRISPSALGASAASAGATGLAAAPGAQDPGGQDPGATASAVPAAAGAAGTAGAGDTGSPGDAATGNATGAATAAAGAGQAGGAQGANPNMACDIVVPHSPLSAAGLATPWQLTGPDGQSPAASGCQQSNPNLQAFVQATILNPATGALDVYQPLVITQGTGPAEQPVVPNLPPNAIVNIMVGFNGTTLRLVGAGPFTLAHAHCVDGAGGSLFGQVSYCNSVQFYTAARTAMAQGMLQIPANATSPVTGQPCPTTRSFDVVDQDPSDNVTTQYLLTGDGRTAQDSAANAAGLAGATAINNGSDNRLLDNFLLPALGCTPPTAPDLSAGGAPGTSQTLDELFAAQNQRAPIALVPENDPMTLVGNQFSRGKTNLYRLGVGQPLLGGVFSQQASTPANFCTNMLNAQSAFVAANMNRFANVTSPVPAMGSNLFTFLAARLSASFANLNCANFGLNNPVTLTMDGNGVAVAAAFNLNPQQPGGGAQDGGRTTWATQLQQAQPADSQGSWWGY